MDTQTHTDRQIETDRHTDRTDRQTVAHRQTDGQTHRQTDRHTDGQTHRQTDRQTVYLGLRPIPKYSGHTRL